VGDCSASIAWPDRRDLDLDEPVGIGEARDLDHRPDRQIGLVRRPEELRVALP
jgi:hypothetical protein